MNKVACIAFFFLTAACSQPSTTARGKLDVIDYKIIQLKIANASVPVRNSEIQNGIKNYLKQHEATLLGTLPEDDVTREVIRSEIKAMENYIAANNENVQQRLREISMLEAQKTKILKSIGIEPGHCEIHEIPMTSVDLPVTYGLRRHSYSIKSYHAARLGTFRNGMTDISGGCILGDAETIKHPVCRECIQQRDIWIKKHKNKAEQDG